MKYMRSSLEIQMEMALANWLPGHQSRSFFNTQKILRKNWHKLYSWEIELDWRGLVVLGEMGHRGILLILVWLSNSRSVWGYFSLTNVWVKYLVAIPAGSSHWVSSLWAECVKRHTAHLFGNILYHVMYITWVELHFVCHGLRIVTHLFVDKLLLKLHICLFINALPFQVGNHIFQPCLVGSFKGENDIRNKWWHFGVFPHWQINI